jgi:hypothetical protein
MAACASEEEVLLRHIAATANRTAAAQQSMQSRGARSRAAPSKGPSQSLHGFRCCFPSVGKQTHTFALVLKCRRSWDFPEMTDVLPTVMTDAMTDGVTDVLPSVLPNALQ